MGLKVLSLFDGMSCGQLALQKLGIEVDTYYASEIDKFAIQVTQANFPNTIQVGDVCELKVKDFKDVNLILAGSPCQGFSFAGKQLAFDDPRSALFFEFVRLLKGIKPKYFLLENVKMKQQFQDVITEQVSACYPDLPGDMFGSKIEPILINSALLSAQNRQRLYWTNIPNVEQPVDKGIVLKDILEDQDLEEYALSEVANERAKNNPRSRAFKPGQEKSGALLANQHKQSTDSLYALKKPKKEYISKKSIEKYVENKNAEFNDPYNKKTIKGNKSTALRTNSSNGNMWVNEKAIKETKPKQVGIATDIKGHDILKRVYSPDGKSPTLNSMGGGNREPKVIVGAWRGRYNDDGKTQQKLELNRSGKSNSLTTVQKDNVVVKTEPNQINPSKKASGKQPYMQDRIFHKEGKSHALTSSFADRTNVGEPKLRTKSKTVRSGGRGSYDRHEWDSVDDLHWRKLTPLECERLQTVPDNYTNHVSNSQRFRMLGNGWTVDVIAHILNNMEL